MEDQLLLIVKVKGENIMRNPLLAADGVAFIGGERRDIAIETPITSIPDFIETFEGLFQEEKQ
ncbi:unnamed protein product [marine sediment metagenome]|uniref:Uncharacterized protein n=1 Tax=marine sediment metagenome TaxID=412755 RepID=X1KNA5_9ZZZZ